MGIFRYSLMMTAVLWVAFSSVGAFAGSFSKNKFYLGVGAGLSSYGSVEEFYVDTDTSSDFDDGAIAISVFGGWEIIPRYLSVEVNYVNFGEVEGETREEESVGAGTALYVDSFAGTTTAMGLAFKGAIPFGDRVSAYARLGYSEWQFENNYEFTNYFNGMLDSSSRFSDTYKDNGFFYSFGAEYRVNGGLIVYGEYLAQQAEVNGGGQSSEWFEASAFMAGVRWEFSSAAMFGSSNSKKSGGSGESSGSRDITACDEKFKDISGFICNGRD